MGLQPDRVRGAVSGLVGRARVRARSEVVRLGYFTGPWLMSRLRKRWVVVRNPQATIRFGKGTFLGPRFSLHMPNGGTFVTGEHVEFRRGFHAELAGPDARIEIGSLSVCTYDVLMQCSTSIVIGERCMLAQNTLIVDGSHRFRDRDRPVAAQGYDFTPIRIGDEVWVSGKCTIIADVGRRAVVAANAVVTRPVAPFCVAAGVPARVIDYFGPPEDRPAGLSVPNSDRSG